MGGGAGVRGLPAVSLPRSLSPWEAQPFRENKKEALWVGPWMRLVSPRQLREHYKKTHALHRTPQSSFLGPTPSQATKPFASQEQVSGCHPGSRPVGRGTALRDAHPALRLPSFQEKNKFIFRPYHPCSPWNVTCRCKPRTLIAAHTSVGFPPCRPALPGSFSLGG